jgi:hypothetical protein
MCHSYANYFTDFTNIMFFKVFKRLPFLPILVISILAIMTPYVCPGLVCGLNMQNYYCYFLWREFIPYI